MKESRDGQRVKDAGCLCKVMRNHFGSWKPSRQQACKYNSVYLPVHPWHIMIVLGLVMLKCDFLSFLSSESSSSSASLVILLSLVYKRNVVTISSGLWGSFISGLANGGNRSKHS